MKTLLILLAVLGLSFYFYQQGSFPDLNFQAAAPVIQPLKPSATHDFNTVSAKLRQDMDNIPGTLGGEGSRPGYAFDVKRRVRPHLQLHPEYQTLTRVCDLIIQADAQRSALQQSARGEQSRSAFRSVLEPASLKSPAPSADNEQAAIQQRMDSLWNDSRTRTSSEVDRLLATLKGKTL